jgi:hypothetical protein
LPDLPGKAGGYHACTRVILLTAPSVCYSTVPSCLAFGRSRVILAAGAASGCQPAMIRTCCRAFFIVGDAGEAAAQFDGSRQFAILFKDGADRGGIGAGDNEHDGNGDGHRQRK